MKNEKVDFSNLIDFAGAIFVLRLIRARINSLDRKRRKLDTDDEMGLMELSHEIAALEKVCVAVTELALLNSKQLANGKAKETPVHE